MNQPAHLAQPEPTPTQPAPVAQPATEPTQAAPAAPPDAPPTVAPTTEPPAAAPPSPAVPAQPEPQSQASPQPAAPSEPEPEPQPVRTVPKVEEYVLPEGVPIAMAEFAHANDFTQEQLDVSLQQFGNMLQANREVERKVMLDAGNQLVQQWGEQSEQNLSIVRRALRQNDPQGELAQVLESTGYGSHPAVLNFFLHLGTQLQEGGFLKSSVNTPTGNKTAAQTLFGASHPIANQ